MPKSRGVETDPKGGKSTKNQSVYLLLTLSPGTVPKENAFMAVVEWPSWRIVETYERKHTLYKDTHKGFAGANLIGNKLIVATEAEILYFSLAPLKLTNVVTKRFLNDVHHLAAAQEGYAVVNTGLDCLEFFDKEGNHKSTTDLISLHKMSLSFIKFLTVLSYRKARIRWHGNPLYGHLTHRLPGPNIRKFFSPLGIRRQEKRDLRYYDLRPHFLHPNHVTIHEGNESWVTLLNPGTVIRVPDGRVLASDLGRPHDGIVNTGDFFVTDCQNSCLNIFEMNGKYPSEKKRRKMDVIPPEGKGYLRGVAVVGEKIFAGLSALRKSVNCPNGRITVLNRTSGEIEAVWEIPNEYGTSIYTILDVSDYYR